MRLGLVAIASGALILILPSAQARAQDSTSSVSEASVVVGGSPYSPLLNGVLSDPLFLPAKGRLYGSGVSSITLATSDNYDGAGSKRYARNRHDIGLSHSLAYGLTPRLSVHGGLGYSFNAADDTAPTGVVTKSTGRSFNNSGFGLTWRALEQKRRPFLLDLTLNYTPTFFISDPSLRQVVNASVGIGRVMRDLSLQLIGNATYRPTHGYIADDGKTDIEQRAAWNYSIAVRTQFRFSRALSTDASINYALSQNGLTIDRTNQLSSDQDQPTALTLSTGVNYQLIQNRIAFGLYYSHQFWSDSGVTSSDPTQSNFTRNASRNVVTGKIYYVIN
jgi:hypothetical protein